MPQREDEFSEVKSIALRRLIKYFSSNAQPGSSSSKTFVFGMVQEEYLGARKYGTL